MEHEYTSAAVSSSRVAPVWIAPLVADTEMESKFIETRASCKAVTVTSAVFPTVKTTLAACTSVQSLPLTLPLSKSAKINDQMYHKRLI